MALRSLGFGLSVHFYIILPATLVTRKVALHFRRVACTRAAARALRLALGIDVCSLEELADEEGRA